MTRTTESIQAGALAGAIGGVAMLILLTTWAIATGRSPLLPLQWFGGLFYGSAATEAGFSSALWGLVVHMAVASAVALPYTMLAPIDADPMAATGGGIVYGLFAWLLLTFVVLPLVDPFMARAVAQSPIAWFAAHVPYGASLSLATQVRRALDARERALEHA